MGATGDVKGILFEQFARVAKAAAHPKRLEILDLLAQGERNVEQLAEATRTSVTGTSAHLQLLRSARLVERRKEGTRVWYRVASDDVVRLIAALRDVAVSRLAEVDRIVRDYFDDRDGLEPVRRDELVQRAKQGEVVVVDVRPGSEYAAGHIPGALSIPLDELEDRVADLPADAEVVAYCRGPFCVLSVEAVAMLRRRGRKARRLEEGLPEWRLAGLPVASGEE